MGNYLMKIALIKVLAETYDWEITDTQAGWVIDELHAGKIQGIKAFRYVCSARDEDGNIIGVTGLRDAKTAIESYMARYVLA